MEIVRDDAYEEMASTFQCIQLQHLNNVLKENGIASADARRKICEEYLFGLGNFLDQYWFVSGGRRVYPLLCFSTNFLNTDVTSTDLGTVFAPSPMYSHHEYAFGNASYFFDDNSESIPDLK